MIKIDYDKEADAMAVIFKKGRISRDEQIGENVFAGYSRSGDLIEIQILDLSSEDTPWMSVQATAKFLNKSERTILRWIHDGKLNPKKVGKEYRIHPKDLEDLAS